MGFLNILKSLLSWKPRQGMLYRSATWGRWYGPSRGEAQGHFKIRDSSSNKSNVYVKINGVSYLGTFKVVKDSCTLGIGNWSKLSKFYRTPTKNVKFSERYLGDNISHMYGTSHTHTYEFTAEVLDTTKLVKEAVPSQIIRRRGTALVDTSKGILVASGRHKLFLLPGGGANKGESRKKAAIRELREETGLKAQNCKYLFSYNEPEDGRKIRNLHKIFLIKVTGEPKPNYHDVKHVRYWKENTDLKLSNTTKIIINKYLAEFKEG